MKTDLLQVPNTASYDPNPSRTDSPDPQSYDNRGYESPRRISALSDHAEIGPVKKKSLLHVPNEAINIGNNYNIDMNKLNTDLRLKKISTTESINSRSTRFSDVHDNDDGSWWYTFCLGCRQKESHPSWQPPHWRKFCPYPFCPTYRQVSRLLSLIILIVFAWSVTYTVLGSSAAPGGQLFGLAVLTLAAYLGGWVISLVRLPGLIGMMIVGIIFQNVGLVDLDGDFQKVTAVLRKIALTMILTRAGLDLDPPAFAKLKFTIIKLAVIPWLTEACIMALASHLFLDLPIAWGFLLGSIISAVAPAVVVASLLRLRAKGYGAAKGIPTLIIAVAGIDDAVSVAAFGIVQSVMFSDDSISYQIIQGPLCIFGGIAVGAMWGYITKYFPEKHDPFVIPLRILLLLGGGLFFVLGSEAIGLEGAGPLACVAAAFVCLVVWTQQGWEYEENPASTAFEIFWMIFEPILFGITGAQIKFSELEAHTVGIGIGCMLLAIVMRILMTILVGIGSKLNLKEKTFVALSWMSKATVQAALGPVALTRVTSETDKGYAKTVLMICVLSIVVSAPLAAMCISLSGSRLLTKVKIPVVPEGWKRSHRPSIRDISIADENEISESSKEIDNEEDNKSP